MIKGQRGNPQEVLELIEGFLANCRHPAALEYGDMPIPLTPNTYSLEIRAGRVMLEVWDDERCVSRRIAGIERRSAGLLDCFVEKFGGRTGKLTFLDLDRPQTAHRSTAAGKQHFAERFRRILSRQFPEWQISTLSAGLDLQRSFSSVFPRALLRRGTQLIAAMACPSVQDEAALLTYGLLWHSHVRESSQLPAALELCIFLPDGAGILTAHRLRWLNGSGLRYRLFLFNEHGSAGEVDPADLGNLETRVAAPYTAQQVPSHLACQTGEAMQSAPELPGSKGYGSRTRFFSERWFESAVRSHMSTIDAELMPHPVYSQVLSFAAQDRDMIDLVSATYSGALAVLELKVSEDIHLPMQALDYWMRVRWHAERAELGHLFPNVVIERRPPKLLLVAPALSFHPATGTLLRYFSPDILVERVGVNTGWQDEFKIVLRLRGSEMPISQRPGQELNHL